MRKLVRVLIWVGVAVAVLAGVAYVFFDPWRIPGDDAQFAASIEPTMSAGEVVLVSRLSGASDGSLVRCTDPDAPGRYVVGRVIGSGNDEIEFGNGVMLVNKKLPTASVACEPAVVRIKNPATDEDVELRCHMEEFAGGTHPALRSDKTDRDIKATVEPGKVYLVSDDRVLHMDSRDFGQVSPGTCHPIVLRLWGNNGWGDSRRRFTSLW